MFFADPPSRCHTLSRAGARSDPSRRAPLRRRRRRRNTRTHRIFPRTARTTAEAQAHRTRRPQFQAEVAPAELALASIVASRRNVALEAERMKRGEWPCTLSHRLRGSTL